MDKKVLIIMNPRSGTMRANRYLTEIAELFVRNGYMPTVLITTKQGDGTVYAKKYAPEYDLVVAIGGDGTFNEVASGVLESGVRTPVGYIPAGSTNDFASSLGMGKDVILNAKNIVNGEARAIDIGCFNGRFFSYVASFGAFTKASYSTPQSIKNTLGHLAYILEGAREVTQLRPIHMEIEADGQLYEGDYLLGAFTNATTIGGILNIRKEYVDMSDGMFEMLLVKTPKDPIELADLIHHLSLQDYYDSNMFIFVNAKRFKIKSPTRVDWSLDGEQQDGAEEIVIENIHGAIDMVLPKKAEPAVTTSWMGREIKYE